MQPSAGTVLVQCKEPSPWALTLPSLSHLPVSAKEVHSWPPQNCPLHPSLCNFPQNSSTHTLMLHQLTPMGTTACTHLCVYLLPSLLTVSWRNSEFLQGSTALLIFLPNTSQGGLKHSKLPRLQAPTTATSILKPLRYITYSGGAVFHLKALPVLTQGKNMLRPASSSGPRGST